MISLKRNVLFILLMCIWVFPGRVTAETLFLEAESFTIQDGWSPYSDFLAHLASDGKVLWGGGGNPAGAAKKSTVLKEAGHYRIWVRYYQLDGYKGPFRLSVEADGKEIGGKDFAVSIDEKFEGREFRWDFFEVDLPAGEITLALSKYKNENCSGYARLVDCILLTTDANLVPNHLDYAPQTYLRVTIGKGYERPVQIHFFVPFAGHFWIARNGIGEGTGPAEQFLLKSGETSPWCNITKMLHPSLNVGGRPIINARYTYFETAPRLVARFEFATAPDEKAIVKTLDIDYSPGTLYLSIPENLATPENLARFKTDREIAGETGKIADSFQWPTFGHPPKIFPFFAYDAFQEEGDFAADARIVAREMKTLDYFGFSNRIKTSIGGGTWYMKNGSYCSPDTETMKRQAKFYAEQFAKTKRATKDIVYCMIMDEPTGQPASFMVKDPGYMEKFREWLKAMGKKPADLLVSSWDEVKPVEEKDRDKFPALYYFTQRFRTRALGDFIAVQGKILQETYGTRFPIVANFSDGAVYYANFYGQGVDYFELLDSPDQNAIWGECGGALASTYQCTSYNVDLMRAAARKYGQIIGHYLIDYGRKPWDSKCKAVSEAARGVKIFTNYFYGPTWASYEGGPAWASGAWYAHPEKWYGNAELLREFGSAEDFLVPAKTVPGKVAILYSSATDIWTKDQTFAYGFDRMHIWLALAHAQVPVDIVSEKQVEEGILKEYKVCYLAGPNLTQRAAEKLVSWVQSGGVLYATAGAGSRDEYNRPMTTVEKILPARRGEVKEFSQYLYYGSALWAYTPSDEVLCDSTRMEVLLVKQTLTPADGSWTLARFKDGSPAIVKGRVSAGTVYCAGFLPGLSYARPAIMARRNLVAQLAELRKQGKTDTAVLNADLLERTDNPWEFPETIRRVILEPVRAAKISFPIVCSVPLVDAVYMECDKGVLIPLANYTFVPQKEVQLTVTAKRNISRIESAHQGELKFSRLAPGKVSFSLPLESTDFVKLYY